MNNGLDGKVAIVTGAGSGIGEAVARLFVAQGAKVVLADVDLVAGGNLAEELTNASFCRADVSQEPDIAALVDHAVRTYGRLDCMVNNAGIIGAVGSIREMTLRHWRATMSVLLDGAFLGCKHAATAMAGSGGGTILNTASVAGMRGGFGAHAYTTAKHAVIGLTRSAASELAPLGIRVNAVAPGSVVTPLIEKMTGIDSAALGQLAQEASPLGKAMYPADIAGAFAYLASDAAAHVTGQVLTVDAGLTMAPLVADFHRSEPAFLGPASLLEQF